MTHSVYWIRHADHTDLMTQGYVGVSGHFDRRMWEHFKLEGNRYLKFAIKKYGWDALVKSQLVVSTAEYCLSLERKLRPEDKIGWNIVAGGGMPPKMIGNKHAAGKPGWNKGTKTPEATRAKISAAIKLQMQDPIRREINRQALIGKPSHMLGKKHTAESIEKMRLAQTGKVSKKKGRLLTEEQKANLSKLMRLNPWTCPHCQKIGYSGGAKNRWHFDNCKLNGELK